MCLTKRCSKKVTNLFHRKSWKASGSRTGGGREEEEEAGAAGSPRQPNKTTNDVCLPTQVLLQQPLLVFQLLLHLQLSFRDDVTTLFYITDSNSVAYNNNRYYHKIPLNREQNGGEASTGLIVYYYPTKTTIQQQPSSRVRSSCGRFRPMEINAARRQVARAT